MKYSLPDSADDLPIKDGKLLMRSLSIYEILRRFSHILRLTPFRYEDFVAAILADDQSALLSEIHIQLLRTLVRDDRQQQTWLGPPDIRDSINLYLHLVDHSNWPAALRLYLSADPRENEIILGHLRESEDGSSCYPFNADLVIRLDVLERLCDQFLLSALARDEIVNPTLDKNDSNSISQEEKIANLKRHEVLGIDQLGRRYWFLIRRIVVVDETEDDVRYYTTKKQFKDIIDSLREDESETSLIENLTTHQEDIERQMQATEDLYATLMKDYKKEDGTYSLLLGQDGAHRSYTNNYPSNSGKVQPQDRDMLRSLSNKFCMSSISSFKWHGAIDGPLNTMASTIRTTILKFESQLPQTFVHPCWQAHRNNWIKLVTSANSYSDYAKALTELEACIKPVLFRGSWYNSVGFTALFRSTFLEREELKKIDRQPRGFERNERSSADFELSLRLGTMVKFSSKLKPVKHQVWKQKGEEYRLTGLNGWYWQGITRRSRMESSSKLHKNKSFKMEDLLQKKLDEMGKKEETEAAVQSPQKNDESIALNKNQQSLDKFSRPKLPPTHNFLTKRGKVRSIFVLPDQELRRLARSSTSKEARTFNYAAKQNHYIWPYGMTPRPTIRTCWLFRNELINSIQDVALQLKYFYTCIRWDDLQATPPVTGYNTIVTDDATITIELLKRRDKLPYLTHSEYLIRKITTPIEVPTKYKKVCATKTTQSARSGLRARRQVVSEDEKKPTKEEIWVSEYELELWELKQFNEKIERQNALIRERALREEAEKRRRLEEQKRRASAEVERRRIKLEQEEAAAKKARLSTPIITYQNSKIATSTTPQLPYRPNINNSINIPPHQQGSQTPTAPVLRYFRTEQGQIIRLPASYLQRGTPLILRHVSPGTNQTNTYIIRPQTTPPAAQISTPLKQDGAAKQLQPRPPVPTTTTTIPQQEQTKILETKPNASEKNEKAATVAIEKNDEVTEGGKSNENKATTNGTTSEETASADPVALKALATSVGTVANEMAHDQHAPTMEATGPKQNKVEGSAG